MQKAMMLKRVVLRLTWGALALSAPTVLAGDGSKILLTRNLRPGSVHFVEMNDEIETFNRGGFFGEEGVTRKSTRLRTAKRDVSTAGSNDGLRVAMTYDRVAMFTETAAAPVSFDSDADDPTDELDDIAVALGPFLGKTIAFDVDAKGHVLASHGVDALYDAVEESAAGGMLFVKLEDELTPERIRFDWHDSHAVLYPNKPVGVGDTWEATTVQPSVYLPDIVRHYHCKVEFIGKRDETEVVEVSYRVKMASSPDAKPKSRMYGMSMSLKEGSAEGKATYDLERGEFVTQTEDGVANLTGVTDGPKPGTSTELASRITTKHSMAVVTPAQRAKQRKAGEAE